jgi:hypothetical protein
MLKVFLVDNDGSRKISLGEYKFNDKVSAQKAAIKRHPKLFEKMQTNSFHFEFEYLAGPYRKQKTQYQKTRAIQFSWCSMKRLAHDGCIANPDFLSAPYFQANVMLTQTREVITRYFALIGVVGHDKAFYADAITGRLFNPDTLEPLTSCRVKLLSKPVPSDKSSRKRKGWNGMGKVIV